jgi:hypothetical protein
MKTAIFSSVGAGRSMVGDFLTSLQTMFLRMDPASVALAASLAGEVRVRPELPGWLLSIARLPRNMRAATLLRTANTLRQEPQSYETVDALRRMAARPGMFRAVLRELHGPNVLSSI